MLNDCCSYIVSTTVVCNDIIVIITIMIVREIERAKRSTAIVANSIKVSAIPNVEYYQ